MYSPKNGFSKRNNIDVRIYAPIRNDMIRFRMRRRFYRIKSTVAYAKHTNSELISQRTSEFNRFNRDVSVGSREILVNGDAANFKATPTILCFGRYKPLTSDVTDQLI